MYRLKIIFLYPGPGCISMKKKKMAGFELRYDYHKPKDRDGDEGNKTKENEN